MALVAALSLDARDLRRQNTSTQRDAATTGTGLLMGVVVDPLTDRAVAGSLVTLAPGGQQELTDEQGHFVFTDLPAGTYIVVASMAGYSDGAYGRRRPSGSPQELPLADGGRIGDLKIPIWRNGAVTGTITDDIGEPAVEVPVQILLRTCSSETTAANCFS
jgi:hypothetical protein